MKIIGCDYHPSFQQIAMVDLGNGRVCRAPTLARRWGSAMVLRVAEWAGASRSGKQREHVVVRAAVVRMTGGGIALLFLHVMTMRVVYQLYVSWSDSSEALKC